ncbi:hypothetical protein ACH4UM_35545 [Streptomyces sp. NPDC020801]|uniref:hypothetical protein n=1 Tax=unclassified Streptomyces TaxID=2593676 RepID=UPI0037968C70
MSASPAVRSLRAAVFAAVCVLLAAAGHGLAMGTMPPLWADGAGFVGVFGAGWLLGGRERSLPGIGATMLVTQVGLHFAFDAARAGAGEPGAPHSFSSMASMPMPDEGGMRTASTQVHAAAALIDSHALTSHAAAAHVLAALVASWWLRRGEAALWSLLRRAVAFVPALAAWWRHAPAPANAQAVRRPRTATAARRLRRLLLRHAVSRRGPPARIPYPV